MNTFRMVIVDDEPMIRKGLQALIRRIAPEWEVCGEATNGREALALIRNVKPDLVLTDISMPIMDGIELYAELKREAQTPLFLALSGYTDFSYVRQMLVMGAVDYITKPVEEPILIDKLNQVKAMVLNTSHQKLEESEQSQQLIEYWLHQLLNGKSHTAKTCEDRLHRLGLPITDLFFGLAAVYLNVHSVDAHDRSLYFYFLLKTCQELIPNQSVVIRAEDHMIMVLHWSSDEFTLKEQMIRFEEDFFRFAKGHARIPMLMASGPVFEHLLQLPSSWKLAKMEIRFQLTSDTEMDTVGWLNALKQGQQARIQNLITQAFLEAQPENWRDRFIGCLAILGQFANQCGVPQYLVIDPLRMELPGEDNHSLSREVWINKLNMLVEEILFYAQKSRQQTESPLIVRVKDFIRANLNENLTLQTTADYVRMNPSYLSEVFKEAMGITFIDYVIQQRMELAKRLIIEDRYKLYEIAGLVGYQSPKHFTSVFKRIVGALPSEYKRYVESAPR
ncbi:response regulator [Saccharibacillus sacchari]|uniref:Response regulator n=1 Tax=Saccharibacillus sacchari TaxID=456493 RepID=A0ACC6PE64_9BACL